MTKWQRKAASLVRPFRVSDGRRFRLSSIDPGDTPGFASKRHAHDRLERDIDVLAELQEKLYAHGRWALLLIFQAMDAAGKDSTIKHVMSGVNPQGCQVYSFKAPSSEELDHDYMWRTTCRLPERGRIGIFNRSYYEEVLVVRVHREILGGGRLEGVHLAPLRVHAGHHVADRAVFPRGVHCLKNQQQRPRSLGVKLSLELAEAFDTARQLLRAARLRLDPARVVGIDVLQPESPPVGNRERFEQAVRHRVSHAWGGESF